MEENNIKYCCKCKIDIWKDGHWKDGYSYYIDEKKVDKDFLDTLLTLLEDPKSSVDKEYLKKCIDEL